jgi:rubrerythrin
MLADAEVRHYRLFRGMREGSPADNEDDPILDNVKNVFSGLRETEWAEGMDFSEVDLYRKAQRIEEESRDYYRKNAGRAGGETGSGTFLKIVEERKHFLILESIIEFVSRPES